MGKTDKKSKEQKNSKFLEHGSVVLNTVTRRINVHNIIYCWRIFKYSELQPNVIYFQEFQSTEVKCFLKVLKTKNTLYLCLRSKQLVRKRAQFYVMSETRLTFVSVKATEIIDGLYVGEFKLELFDDPELPYLENGMLTVSFRYVSDEMTDDQENVFDGVDILSDLDELCCDLKHMYLESMYPDFEIKVKDYVFKAHKFILSARCAFFEALFDKNSDTEEITVDTLPGILHEVLLYVYCGELKDMDFACMAKVLELAYFFKISSLVEKCQEYFNSRVNVSNFEEFHAIVKGKPYPELNALLKQIEVKMVSFTQ